MTRDTSTVSPGSMPSAVRTGFFTGSTNDPTRCPGRRRYATCSHRRSPPPARNRTLAAAHRRCGRGCLSASSSGSVTKNQPPFGSHSHSSALNWLPMRPACPALGELTGSESRMGGMTAMSSARSTRRSPARGRRCWPPASALTVLTRPRCSSVSRRWVWCSCRSAAAPSSASGCCGPASSPWRRHPTCCWNTVPVAVATVALVVAAALPLVPPAPPRPRGQPPRTGVRDPGGRRRPRSGATGATGSRTRCRFLWRFHAVHHSIEHMDWLAAARLHPLDAGVHPGVLRPAAVRARLRRRALRRRRRGRDHAARDLPARQRAAAVPVPAVDAAARPSGTTGTTPPTPRPRHQLRPSLRRQALRHRSPAAGPSARRLRDPRSCARRTAISPSSANSFARSEA